jgi:hypothetical protein
MLKTVLISFERPLANGLAPLNGCLADDPLEDDRKMGLRAEARHGGHMGYRQLRIEEQLL